MPSVVPRVKMISSALRGVDEFRGAGAGGFEGGRGAVAQFVDAAMDVGVVVLVVMHAARRSPRAVSATWRRCRNKSAACRGPAGRGSGNPRAVLPSQLSLSFVSAQILVTRLNPDEHGSGQVIRVHPWPLHQTQLQLRRLGHHALVPRRVPDQFHVRLVNRSRGRAVCSARPARAPAPCRSRARSKSSSRRP